MYKSINIANTRPKKNYGLLISVSISVLIAIISINPWPVWHIFFTAKVILVGMFVATGISQIKWKYSVPNAIYMLLMVLFILFHADIARTDFKASVFTVISSIPLLMFPLFNYEYKRTFLKYLIKVYALIVGLSIIFFAVWMFGKNLPSSPIEHPNAYYKTFSNYYFFIIGEDYGVLTRFSSIFTEPGHLGMICSILLYANGYTWKKWENVVMTIALVWSFSLAGYLLFIVGLLIFQISSNKNAGLLVKRIVISILGVAIIVGIVNSLNSDLLQSKILDRLEFDSSKGISGNNRNNKYFDLAYNNMDFSELIIGISPIKMQEKGYSMGNSSYKNFIMQEGYLGLVLVWLCMLMYFRIYPSRKGSGFMILLILSFLQRPYILWEAESFTFFAALASYHFEQHVSKSSRVQHQLIREPLTRKIRTELPQKVET